jgi:hypothetical protein
MFWEFGAEAFGERMKEPGLCWGEKVMTHPALEGQETADAFVVVPGGPEFPREVALGFWHEFNRQLFLSLSWIILGIEGKKELSNRTSAGRQNRKERRCSARSSSQTKPSTPNLEPSRMLSGTRRSTQHIRNDLLAVESEFALELRALGEKTPRLSFLGTASLG